MDVRIVPTVLHQFLACVEPVIGRVAITVTDPLDAACFPDELPKLGGKTNGIYLVWGKSDGRVLYVGISTDIPARIYKHIGPEYSWARGTSKAAFPNCTLAGERNWLSSSAQEILHGAQFNVTVIFPDPPEVSSLLESLLVFWGHRHGCKPEINVEY